MCYVKCRSGNPSDRQQLSQQTCVMAAHIITALATQGLQQWNIICIEWPKLIFHAPDSVRHSNSNLWFLLLNWTEESRSFPGWIYFARFVVAEIDSSKMVLKKVNLQPFGNTSATSYLCNIFLGQDTMSRMGLPVWLDNKHFAHFGHWSCHLRYQGPFMCSNISS